MIIAVIENLLKTGGNYNGETFSKLTKLWIELSPDKHWLAIYFPPPAGKFKSLSLGKRGLSGLVHWVNRWKCAYVRKNFI